MRAGLSIHNSPIRPAGSGAPALSAMRSRTPGTARPIDSARSAASAARYEIGRNSSVMP